MEFLAKDMRSDPWLTYRFRKYMAGPKRIPWKNSHEAKRDYKKTFAFHWLLGALMFWPVACVLGRRGKRYSTGTPIVPYQRFIHDFPNTEPTNEARKKFFKISMLSSAIAGYLFAQKMGDVRQMYNPWYNRPDLKPYPAMVEPDDDEKLKMHDVKMAHYASYRA